MGKKSLDVYYVTYAISYVTFTLFDVTFMKQLVIFDVIAYLINMYFCDVDKICFIL